MIMKEDVLLFIAQQKIKPTIPTPVAPEAPIKVCLRRLIFEQRIEKESCVL